MSVRSILVDRLPSGRIGHVVAQVEPLDDNRHAWSPTSTERRAYEPRFLAPFGRVIVVYPFVREPG